MATSRPPVWFFALGLRLLWYGVFFRLVIHLALFVVPTYFPQVLEKWGNEFSQYSDYGLQGTSWLMGIGLLLCLTVPWSTRAAGWVYLSILFGLAQFDLEFAERFKPEWLPSAWGEYLPYAHLTLMLLSAIFMLRGCRRIALWMNDTTLDTRSRFGFFLCFLGLVAWIGYAVIEKVQPDLFNQIPAWDRFEGPQIAKYGSAGFAGLALLLYANILAFTSLNLREARYEQ